MLLLSESASWIQRAVWKTCLSSLFFSFHAALFNLFPLISLKEKFSLHLPGVTFFTLNALICTEKQISICLCFLTPFLPLPFPLSFCFFPPLLPFIAIFHPLLRLDWRQKKKHKHECRAPSCLLVSLSHIFSISCQYCEAERRMRQAGRKRQNRKKGWKGKQLYKKYERGNWKRKKK